MAEKVSTSLADQIIASNDWDLLLSDLGRKALQRLLDDPSATVGDVRTALLAAESAQRLARTALQADKQGPQQQEPQVLSFLDDDED